MVENLAKKVEKKTGRKSSDGLGEKAPTHHFYVIWNEAVLWKSNFPTFFLFVVVIIFWANFRKLIILYRFHLFLINLKVCFKFVLDIDGNIEKLPKCLVLSTENWSENWSENWMKMIWKYSPQPLCDEEIVSWISFRPENFKSEKSVFIQKGKKLIKEKISFSDIFVKSSSLKQYREFFVVDNINFWNVQLDPARNFCSWKS